MRLLWALPISAIEEPHDHLRLFDRVGTPDSLKIKMTLAENLRKDFKTNFQAHFEKRPRFFLALYMASGLLSAFSAGADLVARSNLWLPNLAGAFVFFLIVYWGVGVLAKNHEENK
jgi:hypothetical protein